MRKLIRIMLCATLLVGCSNAGTGSTNTNDTNQNAEKIVADKLAEKYSEEKSKFKFEDREFTNFFGNVDISYRGTGYGYRSDDICIDNLYESEEYSSVENNMFIAAMYDTNGKTVNAYNKTSMLPEPLLRGFIAVNNRYKNTDLIKLRSNGGYSATETVELKKTITGYNVDDVYTTTINDREVSFFEGSMSYGDDTEGYVCGYTFFADGNPGLFVAGTWGKADNDLKEKCKEVVDIEMRSLTVTEHAGETEKVVKEVSKDELSKLTYKEKLYICNLEYDMPSLNVVSLSTSGFQDPYNLSVYCDSYRFDDGVEVNAENALECIKPYFLIDSGCYETGEVTVENQEPVTIKIGDKDVEAVKFDGTLSYNAYVDGEKTSKKIYGYAFAYGYKNPYATEEKQYANAFIGTLDDVNQSEETYEKLTKLVDDVVNTLRVSE